MKLRDGFILKEVAGNFVVIAVGDDVMDFNKVITVNEIGALIWRALENGKDKNQIVASILGEYDIDRATVSVDFDEFIDTLREINIIID